MYVSLDKFAPYTCVTFEIWLLLQVHTDEPILRPTLSIEPKLIKHSMRNNEKDNSRIHFPDPLRNSNLQVVSYKENYLLV